MKRHQSRPYNSMIANAFFRAGYIESWGRGIQKICDTCRDYGISLPEYIVHPEDIMLKLNALEITKQQKLKLPKPQNDVLGDVLKDVLELKILELLKSNGKVKQDEIAVMLNVSMASVQRAMKRMVKQEKIERKGGKRYGYWEIKNFLHED